MVALTLPALPVRVEDCIHATVPPDHNAGMRGLLRPRERYLDLHPLRMARVQP